MSPLMKAITHNQLALVPILLAADADINLANEEGHTALHFAAIAGTADRVMVRI